MKKYLLIAKLILRLGLLSVGRVFIYKLSIKFKFNKVFRIKAEFLDDDLYSFPTIEHNQLPEVNSWNNGEIYNSFLKIKIQTNPPDWFYNIYSDKRSKKANVHWSQISDFDNEIGDIKVIWELSRFDWIIPMAQETKKGNRKAFDLLNSWLIDWQKCNQPYNGVNWKCGQEASIRVIHLITAVYILDQIKCPLPSLTRFIEVSLKRIEPTVSYAIGQNNNHGTSEAAALYIGGSFLKENGFYNGDKWMVKGRRILEDRVNKLIDETGTFSQYSLNYHRLMIDTICICEVWRKKINSKEFSEKFYEKISLATRWIYNIIDPISGDGPNVGANDGARIIPLSNCDYRDFRPTVQLAMALFNNKRAYLSGDWDNQLIWLNIKTPMVAASPPSSLDAKEGGFTILRKCNSMAILRYPCFKFRPSQNDALHLDFWLKNKNYLRDGGTYSYNTDEDIMAYFGSPRAHNTVQFDDRDQMARISRFLYGEWLKTNWKVELQVNNDKVSFGAGYKDVFGAFHKRSINLFDNKLEVRDEIGGFENKAILRWRLLPVNWKIESNTHNIQVFSEHTNDLKINVECSNIIEKSTLIEGYDSRYYLSKSLIPVLEIEVKKQCNFITTFIWK